MDRFLEEIDRWREASQRYRDAFYSYRNLGDDGHGKCETFLCLDIMNLWKAAQAKADELVARRIQRMDAEEFPPFKPPKEPFPPKCKVCGFLEDMKIHTSHRWDHHAFLPPEGA